MFKWIAAASKSVWIWLKKQKGLSTFTLIASLLGGVPGLINIHLWATDEPQFTFYPETIQNGKYETSKSKRDTISFFLITGAIYNDGKEPLFPVVFRLNIKQEDVDTVTLVYSNNAPDSLLKGNAQFKFENPTDIMRLVKVNPKDATWGCVFFPFGHPVNWDAIQSISLTCIDIKNRDRTIQIPKGVSSQHQSYYIPKTGERFINTP